MRRFRNWLAQRLAVWSYRVGGGAVIRTSEPIRIIGGVRVPDGNRRGVFMGVTTI